MRQLLPLFRSDVHDVNILRAGSAGAVAPDPGKGYKLRVGRPRRRDGISLVGEALCVTAVGIHQLSLRQTGWAADPDDLRGRFRVRNRLYGGALERSNR